MKRRTHAQMIEIGKRQQLHLQALKQIKRDKLKRDNSLTHKLKTFLKGIMKWKTN